MKLDTATTLATAFPSWLALVTACKAGYAPSLRQATTDELPLRRAKNQLTSALTAAGFQVHGA
jgi:hypothetical protein